jgi:hypothetical protein
MARFLLANAAGSSRVMLHRGKQYIEEEYSRKIVQFVSYEDNPGYREKSPMGFYFVGTDTTTATI